jgi:hypothetical protein
MKITASALACPINNIFCNSLSATARAFELNSDKVLKRVRCGWNIYEALEIVERKLPTMNYQDRIEQFAPVSQRQ